MFYFGGQWGRGGLHLSLHIHYYCHYYTGIVAAATVRYYTPVLRQTELRAGPCVFSTA
jgi:hypothetical protein